MEKSITLGCWAAFWGDTRTAAEQVLRHPSLDYLVSDYLSEITMALLARARAKDPQAGYIGDAVAVLAPLLSAIAERGVKVVTNAGALNPAACAAAIQDAADQAGLALRVAAVEGDDLMGRLEEVRAVARSDMFTGQELPADPMTLNAYLGARPIADALGAGADIVVTGRCVDSAVVLGPLMHEFGWSDSDYDLLSAGTLAGHIVECGPQCTGGNTTDWQDVPGWDDMGFPIVECAADGTCVVTKPDKTGGLVSVATIGEQIVYEIGDPGAYVMPDVVCDWRNVRLQDAGPNRVAVSGARGTAPTTTYKVTATHFHGHRVLTTALFTGLNAGGRARRAGEALLKRAERLAIDAGYGPFTETSIEVIGAGDSSGPGARDDTVQEAVVKIGARHPRREALEILSLEFAPFALVAQGMTGFFAGRPRVSPAIRVFHLLVPKAMVHASFRFGDDVHPVDVAAGDPDAVTTTPQLPAGSVAPEAGRTVRLIDVAYARSGDKGDQANIGVIARTPQLAGVIEAQLGSDRVAEHFAHYLSGGVRRWAMPGLGAVNFLLDGALGGTGGTSTLRYDAQAKSWAAMLLTLPITLPEGVEVA